MTKEQYDKATEINKEIQKYADILAKIRYGLSTKKVKDSVAKKTLEKRDDDHNARWQLLRFFSLRFIKQKVIIVPHYEFAQGIEMDADPELIAVILDYLEKKKKACELEFEQIGGADHGKKE